MQLCDLKKFRNTCMFVVFRSTCSLQLTSSSGSTLPRSVESTPHIMQDSGTLPNPRLSHCVYLINIFHCITH